MYYTSAYGIFQPYDIHLNLLSTINLHGYRRVRAEGAGLAGGSHRLREPAHLRLDSVSEHAGDVVPPRVSVDRAAGFIIAVLLGPGVEQVADLPRRVVGAATVHLEDEREKARPDRGADRGRGRQIIHTAAVLTVHWDLRSPGQKGSVFTSSILLEHA